ncbi:calcium-binding protein [Yoonia vestfoldensis]|uniref:calcium-binding protein n=1 Tax=Yoonia vestfoldensis TaxID=245188 RepID=UPI0003702368|nr:calcium-binding protein [Yoonia vestfoldensis]
MDVSILLVLLGLGALVIPLVGGGSNGDDDEDDTIKGSFEDDVIVGTDGNDVIYGYKGDDTISGLGGIDEIYGGEGDDTITGGDGRDILFGGPGDDMIDGGEGNDTIEGGADDDTIDGGYGQDVIRAGRGDDLIFGGPAARLDDNGDYVLATDINDTLRGEGGEDTIYIWGGDPTVAGKEGGFASGGRNDTDVVGEDGAVLDQKDELILVSGSATLEDLQGTTDFFVLANLDDGLQTQATITQFRLETHRLILTVDAETTAPLGLDYALTATTLNGVPGVLVTATLTDPAGLAPDQYEGSSAFLRGATLDTGERTDVSRESINIEVVQTNAETTDYFDPAPTVAFIKSVIPANPAPI